MGRLARASIVVTVVAALGACDRGVPAPDRMTAVSDAEATALAAELIRVRSSCTDEDRQRLVDEETFARRTLRAADAPAARKQAQLRAMRRERPLGERLCFVLANRDDVSLLRLGQDASGARPLLRVRDAQRWPRYFDLELGKARDGTVRVVDVTPYEHGEPLTATTARLLTDTAATGDTRAVGDVLFEIQTALGFGRRDEALRVLAGLPERVRKLRSIRLLELELIGEGDDTAAYVAALERFLRDFPGDPAEEWLELQHRVLRKDGAALVAAVDRFDRRVGGDLQLTRTLVEALVEMGSPEDLAEADRRARRVVEAEPDARGNWSLLAGVQLKRRDHAAVVVTFGELQRRFGVTFDAGTLLRSPIYQAFISSPEFAAWWRTQDPGMPP